MTKDELYEQFRHTKIQLLDEIASYSCVNHGIRDCNKCMFHHENAEDFNCICVQADNYLRGEARQ